MSAKYVAIYVVCISVSEQQLSLCVFLLCFLNKYLEIHVNVMDVIAQIVVQIVNAMQTVNVMHVIVMIHVEIMHVNVLKKNANAIQNVNVEQIVDVINVHVVFDCIAIIILFTNNI